jgi:hypothetical protein
MSSGAVWIGYHDSTSPSVHQRCSSRASNPHSSLKQAFCGSSLNSRRDASCTILGLHARLRLLKGTPRFSMQAIWLDAMDNTTGPCLQSLRQTTSVLLSFACTWAASDWLHRSPATPAAAAQQLYSAAHRPLLGQSEYSSEQCGQKPSTGQLTVRLATAPAVINASLRSQSMKIAPLLP